MVAAGSSSSEQRAAILRSLEERRHNPPSASEMAEVVAMQRSRTSWADSQRADGSNPTHDGLIAGAKHGALYALVGFSVVGAATMLSPAFRTASSAGGRAWLVCTAGMAGFFINSEMAVVGTEVRERAAAAAR